MEMVSLSLADAFLIILDSLVMIQWAGAILVGVTLILWVGLLKLYGNFLFAGLAIFFVAYCGRKGLEWVGGVRE